MKININDENNIVIFLNKENIKKMDFEDKEQLEIYFRELFNTLNSDYNIKVSGYYDIYIYIDNIYGIIVEMEKQIIDFIDFYNNHIDMHITILKNSEFLYQISDPFFIDENIKDKISLYINKNNLYIKVNEELDTISMGKIIENSSIVFGNFADKVISKNKLVVLNK